MSLRLKKIIEAGKTALIALLVLSAVFLGRQTGLFNELFSPAVLTGSAGAAEPVGASSEAAKPVRIMLINEGGYRYGAQYDAAALDELYGKLVAVFGEALGSSGEPEPLTEADFRAKLPGCGVFLDYLNPLPLGIVSEWFGFELNTATASYSARRIALLSGDGDTMDLFYVDGNGGFFRCATAVLRSSLTEDMEGYNANGAQFAYELGAGFAGTDPYAMILPETPFPEALTVGSPLDGGLSVEGLLPEFGMNRFTYSHYPETDGTNVYVDVGCTLRVSGSTVSYQCSDAQGLQVDGSGGLPDAAAMTEFCRKLTADTLGAGSGVAVLYLTSFSRNDGGDCELRFDYFYNGAFISLPGGRSAAVFTISGNTVTDIRLDFRSYAASGVSVKLLPEKQAAAIARKMGGGELILRYLDTGGETAGPAWTVG